MPGVIARGRRSEILDWGEGKVLKLYYPGWSAASLAGEAEATRWLYEHGLPVPAVYGTLEVDGRPGIVMERIEGPAMSDVAVAHPERLAELALILAELQARLHAFQAPRDAPRLRDRFVRRILSPTCQLPPEKKAALVEVVERMPDGNSLCHGDFHPQNVILPPARPPVVIDWDSPSGGNPLGDVGRTLLIMRATPCRAQRAGSGFLEEVARATGVYLDRYFELRPGPRDDLEKWVWINAAARLPEGIREEEAWLVELVDRGFADFG